MATTPEASASKEESSTSNAEPVTPKKLSNAELKALKKAEKAAARAAKKTTSDAPAESQSKSAPQTPKQPPKQQQKGRPSGPSRDASDTRTAKSQQSSAPKVPALAERTKSAESKTDSAISVFAHLHERPKRHTLLGAAKDIHPAIQALGLQYSTYEVCGSTARGIAMLLALKQVINEYTTPIGTSLARNMTSHYLSPQIDFLKSCRPLSVSMGNAIRWLKDVIIKIDPNKPETEAKAELIESIDDFIRERFTIASELVAEHAAESILDGDVVLTYAKSTAVLKALIKAAETGKNFRVVVVDSKPLFEGKELAKDLERAGIKVSYCPVSAAAHAAEQSTRVLLGAHSMLSNGWLQSRIGTAIIAMHAHALSIPVLVCCETIKFTEQTALESITKNEIAPADELLSSFDALLNLAAESNEAKVLQDTSNLQILNPLYDFSPAEYLYLIITEYGTIAPHLVPSVLSTMGMV